MLEFAELLTRDPGGANGEWVEGLREAGWNDADVVDIVHITALYNYMVRVADGLGVDLEPGKGWEPLSARLSFAGTTAPKSFGKTVPAPTD